jgi:Cytochrome c554 and c-prime
MLRPRLSITFAFALCVSPGAAQQLPAKTLTCASCHTPEAKTQHATPMAHAMESPADNLDLQTNPKLEVQKGAYHYTIEQHGASETYSVTDGTNTISVPIEWPFGRNSQTYVLSYNGQLYEGLVSYYPGAHGLDTTIGDQSIEPNTLEQAMGRPISPTEAKSCFGCHSTGSIVGKKLKLDAVIPGLHCQRCHENADRHMEAIASGKLDPLPPKLTNLSSEDMSSFCGQCHRTWQTVVSNRWMGVINVRFQPYRLATSECFDGVDQRISCVACHNPHAEVVQESGFYDKKCLACHSAGAKPSAGLIASKGPDAKMPVCPVAKENCTSCHMPQVDLPGAHRTFTDHNIRIVKANESYPE